MRSLPRLLCFAGLVYLAVVLFQELQRVQSRASGDQSQIFLLFAGLILVALLAGGLAAFTFLPVLGDKLGEMIYGSNDTNEGDPVVQAHEKIEEGDYLGAIESYRTAIALDPDDTAAIGEIADLQCKHLGEYEAAADMLESALERHWPTDEKSFLRCKLAEVYWKYLGNILKARELLIETIEEAPETISARNAQHLLQELENG